MWNSLPPVEQNLILFSLALVAIHLFFMFTANKLGTGFIILVKLPATFLHELSHLLLALLTFQKVTSASIIPRKVPGGGGWILGSVSFIPSTAVWPALVALAPMMYWTFAAYFMFQVPSLFTLPLMILFLEAGVPSTQDFKLALRYPLGIIVFFACWLPSFLVFVGSERSILLGI